MKKKTKKTKKTIKPEEKFLAEACVEIHFGSNFKYEIDKHDKFLRIDRILPESLPYNYGFIPETLSGDGDPLDICILGKYPIMPLTIVSVVLAGVFYCNDNGEEDEKLVGYVEGDPDYDDYVNQVGDIHHYLATYKKGFKVLKKGTAKEAVKVLEDAAHRYYIKESCYDE